MPGMLAKPYAVLVAAGEVPDHDGPLDRRAMLPHFQRTASPLINPFTEK